MSDLASLLERLRGPHRQSECGNFAEVHPDFLNELDIALTAAEAKAARMGEALKPFADASALVEYSDDNGSAGAWIAASDALHLIPRVKHLRAARSALQSEKDREGQP
jgi:hypothetical protein